MILLTVRDVLRQFDAAPVLNHVSFDVRAGEKIGLVGPNGAGKTTLLKIVSGSEEPDAGTVEIAPSCIVARLEQEPDFDGRKSLLDEARAGLAHLYRLQESATEVAHRMAQEQNPRTLEQLQRRYDHLQQELTRLNAFNVDHRVDEVLQGLGFRREEYDRPIHTFSGGQQNRLLLARLLLQAPDLMLLDEPTNHLD
ncbi:MAG TPA: ABC-F family ATP-binding cassette domain-containing protein, partial [Planctomycetaceae bacterium]|nr:ABC-F family ATP-binding cassette domain-containing protein [Planctomycetaceae bacterium]